MDDVTPERWLPIPGYEGYYEVSDRGRVRSLPRECPGNNWRFRPGRALSPGPRSRGYLQVNLSLHGVVKPYSVHVLVAAAFHGPRPKGMEIRHLDGNKANNQPSNLAYGTSSENKQDAIRHGQRGNSWKNRPLKTHCPQGHPYDETNTRYEKRGGRKCRKCDNERHKRSWRESHPKAA